MGGRLFWKVWSSLAMLTRQMVQGEYAILPLLQQLLVVRCIRSGKFGRLSRHFNDLLQLVFGVVTSMAPKTGVFLRNPVPRRMKLCHSGCSSVESYGNRVRCHSGHHQRQYCWHEFRSLAYQRCRSTKCKEERQTCNPLLLASIPGRQIAKVQGAGFRCQHVLPDLSSLEFVERITAHAPTHDYTTTSRQQFVDCPRRALQGTTPIQTRLPAML